MFNRLKIFFGTNFSPLEQAFFGSISMFVWKEKNLQRIHFQDSVCLQSTRQGSQGNISHNLFEHLKQELKESKQS